MSSTTVAEFASELKKSTETLLEQLRSAGVSKSAASDALTDADKQKLLSFLQAAHGTATAERRKITLVKKSTSEIKQADATGKARTIQVEVRKKRTFVKRDESLDAVAEAPAVVEAPSAPLIDDAELARREEEARHQAEFIRRQEEELAEKRRLREEQEAREREQAERAAAQAEQALREKQAEAVSADGPAPVEAQDQAAALEQEQTRIKAEAREKAAAES
ncbi:MAG: translation initiation factor IF-2 associated domain-containing protein, partial [Burkholderiaceae bacterium]|nr:translation initiation factor IF-2 associated domain-containing protein [Burkholderiaceae bacterium]